MSERIPATYQGQQEIVEALNNVTLSAVKQKAVWCDTVADMVATNLPQGVTAATRGYGTINDGDGAFYYIREMDENDVEDGKNIIFLDNDNVAELLVNIFFPKTASSAPSTGVHAVGEIIYNSAPSAGGYIGWVCTVAGDFSDEDSENYPIFKGFGAIES